MIKHPGVYLPQMSTRGQHISMLANCRSDKDQEGALLYKRLKRRPERKKVVIPFDVSKVFYYSQRGYYDSINYQKNVLKYFKT